MSYYTYVQMHSGVDKVEDDFLDSFVVIEAWSADEANNKLISLGGYFDGVILGIDNPNAGDRWTPARIGYAEPRVYNKRQPQWGDRRVVVHQMDGTIWYNPIR